MKRLILGLALILILPALALAQTAAKPASGLPSQVLKVALVDGGVFTVTTPDKKVLTYPNGVTEGDAVPLGSTVATGAGTTAELQLVPNKTTIKLSEKTSFVVQKLAGGQIDTNAFTQVQGKIRTIAMKGSKYEFSNQTAACGVRGTDFVFTADGAKTILAVKDGLVNFAKLDADGKTLAALDVAKGFWADAMSADFKVADLASFGEDLFGSMPFKGETELKQLELQGVTEVTPVTPTEAAGTLAAGAAKLTKSDVESGLVKWLKDIMGFELGSVSIYDQTSNTTKTYAKAVIQPNFNLGKVKLGLYLPIIYNNDMFNPNDWYHPNGNDEWSFGSTQFNSGDYVGGAVDFASDLALKIKYFELGVRTEARQDPFYLKVGNLKDFTLGHGLIMRNYANDTEFPAVRRVGFDLGIDAGGVGFEAIANDLADVENGIFGGRLYIRPIKDSKLAFGLSGVVDINPFEGAAAASINPDSYGNPMMLGAGIDLDLPIIQSDLLSLRLFADAAAETEYLRSDATAGGGATSGLKYELIFNPNTGAFNNWGAAGGILADLLFLHLRLEYRYYTGIFAPALFDSTYDKTRMAKAIAYATYVSDPASISTEPTVMGIYGEGGFSLIKDKLAFTLGYMWPWAPGKDLAWQLANANDEFHAKLVIQKGLIPIFDVYGTIFYDRKGLVKSISGGDFQFLDGETSFGGEVVVPVPKTPGLSVAAVFAAIPGTTNSSTGISDLVPSVTLETRLSF